MSHSERAGDRLPGLLAMSDRQFELFASVLELDTPHKLRTVEGAATVARQYLAPFIVKAAVDMLGDLYAMVSADTRARVVFLGRDGYSVGDVIEQLDPLFHNRFCGELHIPRVLADSVLDEAAPWSASGADGFRKPGPHRDEPSDSWGDLVRYAEDSNLYFDRSGLQFAVVDTGFKGSVQEMLTAAYPDLVFHGHYLFFCAADDDRHADRKQGYALHLGQPNALNGRAIRDRFVDDPALTFAHHDAIVAIEDLMRGPDISSRVTNGGRLHLDSLRKQDDSLAGISPARVSRQYADPYVRQAVLAAVSTTVAVHARDIRRARAEAPDTWYADLTDRAAALRPQLHEWLAARPADPALAELLDSFVRRSDKDQWMSGHTSVSTRAARSRSTTPAARRPDPGQAPGRAPAPSPPPASRRGRTR
ncbi:hypothetical protein [Streptomyces sp. NPDC002962]|uniref:hypothetical protein n=1 Tax=Streptomyces sp. NPDC002962 TaxID=3364674 RepID=UPI0036A542FC